MGRKAKGTKRKRLDKSNGDLNGHEIHISGIGAGRNTASPKHKQDRKAPVYSLPLVSGYRPEYAQQAAELVLNGALERDLIMHFQVTQGVFRLWQVQHPEFAAALAITKEASLADQQVIRSMYEMANGYDQEQVKVLNVEGEIRRVKYRERVQKNFNAAKFWLMNRDPVNWGRDPDRDKGNSNTPSVVNLNMVRGLDTDQLKATISVLQGIMLPGGGGGAMKRLDHVPEAEVVEPEPKPKAKGKRK